ncbi:Hypothetical protein ERS075638_00909 [Mycobacteroides abscessus]|nr:Hypothetical protein ERS075638_00909 [Mycobacteroides abscessus]
MLINSVHRVPVRRALAAMAAPLAAAALTLSTPALGYAAGPDPASPATISAAGPAPAGPGCRHHNCWPRPGWGGGHGGGWGHGSWGGHGASAGTANPRTGAAPANLRPRGGGTSSPTSASGPADGVSLTFAGLPTPPRTTNAAAIQGHSLMTPALRASTIGPMATALSAPPRTSRRSLKAPPRHLAVGALSAAVSAVMLAAPAAAGPGEPGPQAPGNAQIIITELKTRGDQVIINGDTTGKPLAKCTATAVRVGRHIYNQVPQRKGPPTRTLAAHVMYVTVQC